LCFGNPWKKFVEVDMSATITREKVKAKIDRGEQFQLVETLPEEAYLTAHLPGAIHLAPDSLRELAAQVLPDKEAEIIVYCAGPT
jgi:rhodanese-related sulfurtransferase